jgi:hypothetical protein
MNSPIFWGTVPCSPLKVNQRYIPEDSKDEGKAIPVTRHEGP